MEIPKLDINLNEELFPTSAIFVYSSRFPTRDEYTKIALVAAAGVVLIGIIGFAIYELFLVLPA